jgi:hypothetical protein
MQWLIIVKHICGTAKWWVLSDACGNGLDGSFDNTFLGVKYL